ncbi:MAG: hypothetical protein B7Y39_02410 [Bdellovibrio sp. 28-41-41]|nr:MAG: hypothetical protein B7Y39_02410 [Bdellovibrio sp. 28-41-41]
MKSLLVTFPFITLLFTNTVFAGSASLAPGEYIAEHGRGTLLVTARKKGLYFKINAYGANGHSCFAEGIAENNINIQKVDGLNESCTITFTPKADLVVVSASEDGCQGFCGARASLAQEYFKTDEVCLSKNKSKSLKLFKTYYSKKTYDLAEKTLRTVFDSCKKYMSIFEQLEIINDLAVTYKNLNKKDECVSLIKPFDETADMSESDIKEGYPPGDADNLLPLAKKLKFNRELCRGLK